MTIRSILALLIIPALILTACTPAAPAEAPHTPVPGVLITIVDDHTLEVKAMDVGYDFPIIIKECQIAEDLQSDKPVTITLTDDFDLLACVSATSQITTLNSYYVEGYRYFQSPNHYIYLDLHSATFVPIDVDSANNP